MIGTHLSYPEYLNSTNLGYDLINANNLLKQPKKWKNWKVKIVMSSAC